MYFTYQYIPNAETKLKCDRQTLLVPHITIIYYRTSDNKNFFYLFFQYLFLHFIFFKLIFLFTVFFKYCTYMYSNAIVKLICTAIAENCQFDLYRAFVN